MGAGRFAEDRRVGTEESPGGSQPSLKFQPALDGLRAVAVGAVIAYHYGAAHARGGFLGVDVFLVLSGYLITSLLLSQWRKHGSLNLPAFWARRARRLLPALCLVLIAVVTWARFEIQPDRLGTVRGDALSTLYFGANWHFISSGNSYFAAVSAPSLLKNMWYVALLVQFLFVWPLVVFACLRLGRNRTRVLAAVCVVGIAFSTFLQAHFYAAADPSRSYYGTDTRGGELLVGVLLAVVLAHWAPRARRTGGMVQFLGLVAAAGCIWALTTVNDHASWLYHGGFLAFAVATALVITAVVQPVRSPLRLGLSWQPVQWVGRISYGLYLWYWPVMVALSAARTGLSGWSLVLVWLSVSFAAATLSYYLVELPIRRGMFGSLFRGVAGRIATPIGVGVTLVAVLGATAAATAPPQFLTAPQGKVLKTNPPAAPTPRNPDESRFVLLGDSVAASLAGALQAEATKRGLTFQAATRPGCGMVTGILTLADRSIIAWGPTCDAGTPDYLRSSVQGASANVVVWLSTWETADRLVNGRWYKFGTPSGDKMLLEKLDESRRIITANGARILLLTVPPPAAHSDQTVRNPTQEAQFEHLNQLFQTFAAQHAESVTIVDFARIVCPNGPPCPEYVDGIRLRPRDGGHFEGGGPAWVAPRLLDAILKALPDAATPRSSVSRPPSGAPIAATAVSSTSPTTVPTPVVPPPTAPPQLPSMLLVGDSVADSIQDALAAEAAARGIAFSANTRPGCGVITGVPAYSDGTVIPWGPGCSDTTPSYLSSAVHQTNPQVVLWFSTWETADRIVDGHDYHFGTPEADAMLLAKFEETRQLLTAGGAQLLLLTVPPHAAHSDKVAADNPADDATYLHLNVLFQTFASEHPDSVKVVDFARIVCPNGPPCPEFVDGVRLRPSDGGHFAGDGPAWIAPRLLTKIIQELHPTPHARWR
jgi:peptidoglycan/LPS O-acetylase OafA/YrhL